MPKWLIVILVTIMCMIVIMVGVVVFVDFSPSPKSVERILPDALFSR